MKEQSRDYPEPGAPCDSAPGIKQSNDSRIENLQHSRASLSNPWVDNKLRLKSKCTGLIAYIRTNGNADEYTEQLCKISDYCNAHGYYINQIFSDDGEPSIGLQRAVNALDEVGGLIATDLNRFIHFTQSRDRLRELRPFLRHFISHSPKHLIAVDEGIDTHSPAGQHAALDLMLDNTDCFFP